MALPRDASDARRISPRCGRLYRAPTSRGIAHPKSKSTAAVTLRGCARGATSTRVHEDGVGTGGLGRENRGLVLTSYDIIRGFQS